MPERAQQIFRYLHDCYRADNRDLSIFNVFASKVQYRHVLGEPDELLSGALPEVPVAEPELYDVRKTAALHRQEKELLLGTVLLTGYVRESGKVRTICAPLLTFPAEIRDGVATPMLAADLDRRRVQFPLLAYLASLHEVSTVELDRLSDAVPQAPLDVGKLGAFADLLERAFPEIPAEDLRLFPQQVSEKELRKRLRAGADDGHLRWLFASALLLIEKSVDTRGVLTELRMLAEDEKLSAPLRLLLEDIEPATRPSAGAQQASGIRVPAILSGPQQRILRNAAEHSLSLVIGPPGTGKSFTIAALALDAVRRGESVIVASRMNHAVDVVADKIEHILGLKSFVVRGGRKQYLKELKEAIRQILGLILPIPDAKVADVESLTGWLARLEKEIAGLEAELARRSRLEQAWGRLTAGRPPLNAVLRVWRRARWFLLDRRLRKMRPYWELLSDYDRALVRYLWVSSKLLRATLGVQLKKALITHRRSLVRFSASVRARTAERKQKHFSAIDHEALLSAFPIWMVNLADVGEVVPLLPEIFDLAIIDEATQCDIASSLPLLQRARRAVIVGDPHQLRHVSFLSRSRQQRAAERAGLSPEVAELFDYRDKSILDLTLEALPRQDQVTLLDEHFRSAPPIIDFSNREFYGGRLKIMQERPGEPFANCLEYRQVDGERGVDGANPREAEALTAELLALLAEEAEHAPDLRHSVGVLSPFAAQVELLTRLVTPALTSDQLAAHNLLIGTPFSFQGEERDVMFLSLAVDARSHGASFRFLNRPDVFNVAVTRARGRQVIYGSLAPGDPRLDGLLRRYLEHVASPRRRQSTAAYADDPFLTELREELERRGFTTWPAYPVAGFRVDLVVERNGAALGIDLVGYPGEYAGSFEIERYRLWNRAGLKILPLPYSAWCRDRGDCLRAVEEAPTFR